MKPTIKSLTKRLTDTQIALQQMQTSRDSWQKDRHEINDKLRKAECDHREERQKNERTIEDLREQIRQSDIAGNAYRNKVLIYFMALANPEVSKDTEHMKRLMADVVQPYSTVDWCKKISGDPCFR